MITYEEALAIAKEKKPNIDSCMEYENGYVFCSEQDAGWVGGAGHTRCVVRKKDGVAIPFNLFVVEGTGELMRDFYI